MQYGIALIAKKYDFCLFYFPVNIMYFCECYTSIFGQIDVCFLSTPSILVFEIVEVL